MGILRVYLALCVIATHTQSVFPWGMHDGRQAVQIFYIISGFYMEMVLSIRYNSARDFYLSRFLRIFPTYWVILGAVLIWSALSGGLFGNWLSLAAFAAHPLDHNGATGFLLVTLSNLTVFGQDWIMFFSHDHGQTFHFTKDFTANSSPLFQYLITPQSWSVGVELTFYLLVPYLHRLKTRWLFGLAAATIMLRCLAYVRFGLAHDPWDYRFFPFELCLFTLGMLAYRLYSRVKSRFPQRWIIKNLTRYLVGAAVLLFAFFAATKMGGWLAQLMGYHLAILVTYPFWAMIVILSFLVFGNNTYDQFVGELSYPIYLIHVIVILSCKPILSKLHIPETFLGSISAVVSILLSVMLYQTFIRKLDRKRHRLAGKKANGQTGLPDEPVRAQAER